MSNEMEKKLDLGKFEKNKKIPGFYEVEGREYRYVSFDGAADVSALFKEVVRKINPPLAVSGGVVNENCSVFMPNGESYFALSYKGDIEGWRAQIQKGAEILGLKIAKISGSNFLLCDGTEVDVSRCKFKL